MIGKVMIMKKGLTPKRFQRRLAALIKRCPSIDAPEGKLKAWRREWDDFLFYQCDNRQAKTALDLYELHSLNEATQ